MTPNRQEAYCCGGGSGLVALPEYTEDRLRAGQAQGGADFARRGPGSSRQPARTAACRSASSTRRYGLDVEISAVADLVVKAMRLPATQKEVEKLFAVGETAKVPRGN